MNEFVYIGKIGKAIGLKGYFKVNLEYRNKYNLNNFDRVFILDNGNYNERFIEDIRVDKPNIIKITDVNDRTHAEFFKNTEVYLLRGDFNEYEESGFLFEDLIGCDVYCSGVLRGKVVKADNFGASDVIEVSLTEGKSVILPVIEETIKEILLEEKKICVNAIDDYI